jgi:hypothetical protein
MSDARDATIRPSSLGANTGLSLASLSLASNADNQNAGPSLPNARSLSPPEAAPAPEPITVKPIPINGKKKRGLDYKCETCSKIYRHPSCLIKHRWEHTPHWREASKYVLSKHQQVQLLEAAAILSHLSPSATGTSLPDDRSLWPSFLCGGSIPKSDESPSTNGSLGTNSARTHNEPRISSSVPSYALIGSATQRSTRSRSGSAVPRMHDYNVPGSVDTGITQVRPGLLSVSRSGSSIDGLESPTKSGSRSIPISVPSSSATMYSRSAMSGAWSIPSSSVRSADSDVGSVDNSIHRRLSRRHGDDEMSLMKWDEDEDDEASPDDDEEEEYDYAPAQSYVTRNRKHNYRFSAAVGVKEETEDNAMEWDGGDMEMEMD